MMTRRTALLAAGAGPALGLFDERTRTALISDPSGPHLRIYAQALAHPAVNPVAVADPTSEIFSIVRDAVGVRQIRTFTDAAEMLRTARPQLTIVALEPARAPAAIRLALEHDAHVLAEKPACVRAEDFAALNELAARRQRHLMLAFTTRIQPVVRRARDLIGSGSLGQPWGVTAHYIADQTRLTRLEYQQSWFASKTRAGGGHLIWLGIHYIDLIQFVTGRKIVEVAAQISNVGGQPIDIEDSAAVTLRLDGGALGTLQAAYYLDRGYHNGVTIWCSQGWIRFDPGATAVEWRRNGGEANTETTDRIDAYPELVKAAAEAAQGAREPIVTGAECLHVLKVIFKAYESARIRRLLPVE